MAEPWVLNRFAEHIERWRAVEDPPDRVVTRAVGWMVRTLASDPYRAGTVVPPELDEFSTPADRQLRWRAILPFGSRDGNQIICEYAIDPTNQTVTCWLLGEFAARGFVG